MDESRTRCLRLGFAALVASGFAISCWLVAQDPFPQAVPENPARTLAEIEEDPLLRAIKDRAQLIPSAASNQAGSDPVQDGQQKGRTQNHWRAAELMLRSARLLDRDAAAADRLGQADQGAELRAIAANLRANVVRLLAVRP